MGRVRRTKRVRADKGLTLLRILTTTYLEQAHFFRGEYKLVIELATDNLAALPAAWVYRTPAGINTPAAVYDRSWPTQHAFTVGLAHFAPGTLHLIEDDWAKARSLLERWIGVVRTGNVVFTLLCIVTSSAWALAQTGEVRMG